MDLSPAIIGGISASIAVPLFMWLMKNVKSLHHKPNSHKTQEQLKSEYSKWELFATILFIVFGAAIGYSFWRGLIWLYNIQISHIEPSLFIIAQPEVIWAIPAVFIAIFISAIPMHFSLLYLLGTERYAEYTEYGNQKFNVDTWKLLKYMTYVFIPICIIFITMALNTYASITKDDFISNEFFSLKEKRYSLNDIKEIEIVKSFKAPNGNIVRSPYFVIHFNDGNNYNFHRTLQDLTLSQQKEISDYIRNKTGLNISINDPYKI